jgi:hypothetical protein
MNAWDDHSEIVRAAMATRFHGWTAENEIINDDALMRGLGVCVSTWADRLAAEDFLTASLRFHYPTNTRADGELIYPDAMAYIGAGGGYEFGIVGNKNNAGGFNWVVRAFPEGLYPIPLE